MTAGLHPAARCVPIAAAMLSLIPTLAARAGHARSFGYEFTPSTHAVLALIAGVLILIRPKFLNFIVAVYLIIVGVTGLIQLHF